jgi:predicted RNA polymerase sigma factor
MLERLGRPDQAADALERAAALARTDAHSSFLEHRHSELIAAAGRQLDED